MPVPSALDHLVYAVSDLTQGIDDLTRSLGVAPLPGGSHPAWGTRNAILPISSTAYLEIIGPDPEQAGRLRPLIFGLNTLHQPRLVTWVAKGSRLAEIVARAQSHGIHLGLPIAGSRVRTDGVTLNWEFTDPLQVTGDGLVPFFIDWGTSPHPAASAPAPVSLEYFYAVHPEPERIRRALDWLQLDLEVRPGRYPGLRATLRTPRGLVTLA